MDPLSTLDLLYIVLSFFIVIVGTLLVIVLLRVIKILGPVMEIVDYYTKFKKLMSAYASIPGLIKEKVMDIIKGTAKKQDEENDSEEKK